MNFGAAGGAHRARHTYSFGLGRLERRSSRGLTYQLGRIVPTAERNLNGFGSERDRRRLDQRLNGKIARDLSNRAPYGVPANVDRIVISRRCADRGRRTAGFVMVKMPMDNGRACGMIEIVNVDMGKRRLVEAEQQG
jgi:hypothetical protein